MYYLETNSLRVLLPKLRDDTEFRNNSFTSILSLIELITGIGSLKEFQLRKRILDRVMNSSVSIDFDFPEHRFLKSFGLTDVIPEHQSFTLKIINTLLAVDDFSKIDVAIEKEGLTEYWNHLRKYDNVGKNILKNSFKGKGKEFKKRYSNGLELHTERWDKDYKEQDVKSFLKPVVRTLAKGICMDPQLNRNGLSVETLISSYDGSCNRYMIVSSYYADLKVKLGTEPGSNDYLDLNHIFYIKDEQSIMVTDDKMIFKVLVKLFPNQILRCAEI